MYLAGWSGGGSYLTYVAAQVPPLFAALGVLGGGMPAVSGGPCAPCPTPVFLLSGQKNPLHDLAVAARDRLRACGHDVRWVPLPGADHDAEWAALERGQAAALLDYFLENGLATSPGARCRSGGRPR